MIKKKWVKYDMGSSDYVNLTMDLEIGEKPFSKYPRPQLIRETNWINLNGKWDCGVTVPFPLESNLSGYDESLDGSYQYFTTFDYSPRESMKTLIHFGAVDQICEVEIDGKYVGKHEGGYLPFFFDITDKLENGNIHNLVVNITDTLDLKYPYGKQRKDRGGMWYTPVSGIWQTVWLEEVPLSYIENIKITPNLDSISIDIDCNESKFDIDIFEATKDGEPYSSSLIIIHDELSKNKENIIHIENPKNWSPNNPWLYKYCVHSREDCITGYFALREISIRSVDGISRIFLNNEEIFIHAVLDQGYYPEGIFLPNSEQGYTDDIVRMKELGFNTLRKHIKIEPACYYYDCDRLGMMVMQDMVNNSDYRFLRDTIFPTIGAKYKPDFFNHMNEESRQIFERHMCDTAKYLFNFPCIIYYTIFNEGWGQFCADKMYDILKEIDSTRIIDSASGWFRQLKSDVESKHVYFHRVAQLWHKRPIIISEFGGYAYTEYGHIFNPIGKYGYRQFTNREAMSKAIDELYKIDVLPYQKKGLCGSVYTQLSDVEDEINGLYTYDRKVCKVNHETMKHIAKCIYDGVKNNDRDYYFRLKKRYRKK